MTPTDVFSIANLVAMLMWILMIFTPKWKATRFLMDYKVIPILLSVVYAIYIIQAIMVGGMMDFGSLESVMALFTEENAVLAGWVHYLAFDLLVGMWILDQNKELGINHYLSQCQDLMEKIVQEIGFLLFMIIKFFKTRSQLAS